MVSRYYTKKQVSIRQSKSPPEICELTIIGMASEAHPVGICIRSNLRETNEIPMLGYHRSYNTMSGLAQIMLTSGDHRPQRAKVKMMEFRFKMGLWPGPAGIVWDTIVAPCCYWVVIEGGRSD